MSKQLGSTVWPHKLGIPFEPARCKLVGLQREKEGPGLWSTSDNRKRQLKGGNCGPVDLSSQVSKDAEPEVYSSTSFNSRSNSV